jgi:microcompartment protein CcmK/EutM
MGSFARARVLSVSWGLLLALALAGCGGGGGGGSGDATPTPEPTPTPQPAVITGNFFPLAVGDFWLYTDDSGASGTSGTSLSVRANATRLVDGQSGVLVAIDDVEDGASEAVYLVTASAVREVPVSQTDPLLRAIGPVDSLRFPLHAGDRFVQFDGTVSTGLDLDGDGKPETATVRSDVEVIGLEPVTTPAGSFPGSLHVRTTIRAVVQLTGLAQAVTVDLISDDWLAPDLGPVRSSVRTVTQGSVAERTFSLAGYRVGNRRSDNTPPAVLSLSPADASLEGPAASVRVVFNEAIDAASAVGALTLVDANGQPVAGALTPGINDLTFWPASPLLSGRYTARVAATVTDLFGNALVAARSWRFDLDITGPQVVEVTPAFGAVDVARDAAITVRYDEPLDASSLTTSNVALRSLAGGDMPIDVRVAGDTVTVTPTALMARGVEHQLVLGTFGQGPRDLKGNFAAQTVLPFTTDAGRFGAPVPLQPQAGAEAVAVGDVNGDGRADVVVAIGYDPIGSQAFQLAVYHQPVGGGLISAPQWIATRATYGCRPTSVAIGDVNGDGRQDVVVAEFGCGVEVFLQGVDGVLRAGPFLPSAQSFLVRLADFNADGRLDLIAVGWSDVQARLWLQSAAGVLEEAALPAVQTHGWGTLAAGDLDGDGRADFVVTSGQGDATQAVGVVLQRADGSFAAPIYLPATSPDINPGVAIGDADGDGRAELVVAVDKRVTLWRVENSALVRVRDLAAMSGVGPLVLADVNGDGRLDIVVAHGNHFNCGFGVTLQQPGGSHGDEVCYAGAVPWPQADVLAVGDISGDGRADLVSSKSVLLQRAVGAFAEQVRRPGLGRASLLGRALGSASR